MPLVCISEQHPEVAFSFLNDLMFLNKSVV